MSFPTKTIVTLVLPNHTISLSLSLSLSVCVCVCVLVRYLPLSFFVSSTLSRFPRRRQFPLLRSNGMYVFFFYSFSLHMSPTCSSRTHIYRYMHTYAATHICTYTHMYKGAFARVSCSGLSLLPRRFISFLEDRLEIRPFSGG